MRVSRNWCAVFCFISSSVFVSPVAVDAGDLVDPGGSIEDMVADPVRNDFYATLETDEIVKVSFMTKSVAARVTVPGDPELLAVAPDGSRLYVPV